MPTDVEIGTVRGDAVKVNRDGGVTVRMLDVELTSPTDVQSCQLAAPIGVDAVPMDGDKVLVVRAGRAWPIAIPIEDGQTPDRVDGEIRLYSRKEDGTASAVVTMRVSGDVEINGNSDWAVAYTDLKSAFDQLKSDFDGHMHAFAPGPTPDLTSVPTASTSGVPPKPSTADMSGAKVSSVRFP